MKINYNPYSQDFWDNSWSIYKDLRDNDPVHCMEDFGGAWALSRFEDIWNAHLGSYKDYTSVEGTSRCLAKSSKFFEIDTALTISSLLWSKSNPGRNNPTHSIIRDS